ncbi:hypothetical protein PR202_gb25571 [Eleusine coracana subsp. coracana]|uniref:Uncharacterized protein n=1 Tax=Eleusine coracana subsp. coracana TaxID=191504 RepID=A0AAV5FLK7_ELECO|nr:hypothetical protein PR202_gb25571 [Eleusine coracana subsp. coracana]
MAASKLEEDQGSVPVLHRGAAWPPHRGGADLGEACRGQARRLEPTCRALDLELRRRQQDLEAEARGGELGHAEAEARGGELGNAEAARSSGMARHWRSSAARRRRHGRSLDTRRLAHG